MEKQLLRVGAEYLNIKSELNARDEYNLLLGAHHEFVHLTDYWPWQLANGTWTGAFGHLMNDYRMDWKRVKRH